MNVHKKWSFILGINVYKWDIYCYLVNLVGILIEVDGKFVAP